MAVRGRKPKPAARKKLEGNPGRRKAKIAEPKFDGKSLRCPSFLPAEAKKEWRRLAPLLAKKGLLTEADRATFAAYCVHWSLFVDAVKGVEKFAAIALGAKGTHYLSAEHNLLSAESKKVLAFAAEFGLTPVARTRVNSPEEAKGDLLSKLIASRYGQN